jgi:Ser/Thr protein kinase RdoA (MazF antagonist)
MVQLLRPHLETAEADLLGGDTLVHRDTNPFNLLVGSDRAWMVDWAVAAQGPAWVDVANTAVRLMEADTPAERALEWAAGFPSWREADMEAVGAFVRATCRQWETMAGPVGCLPSNRRFEALLTGAHA